jgi:norsolorinic acid ketoreductase
MEGKAPTLAYGVSKAGANYFVRKVHFEHDGIVALAVHPGWVKTANGQNFADSIGVAEPPMTLEQSVNGVLAQACVSFIQIEMDF